MKPFECNVRWFNDSMIKRGNNMTNYVAMSTLVECDSTQRKTDKDAEFCDLFKHNVDGKEVLNFSFV